MTLTLIDTVYCVLCRVRPHTYNSSILYFLSHLCLCHHPPSKYKPRRHPNTSRQAALPARIRPGLLYSYYISY
jgi:hypothetical protein